MAYTIVIVPGYTNSGPKHWQTVLENKYKNIIRVEQEDWDNPVREKWIQGLDKTINAIDTEIFLVGHSCGSIAIVQWAEIYSSKKIIGSLLVTPADVESPTALKEISIQGPIPQSQLPFKSTIVYSTNDEHLSPARAKQFAKQWGSDLIEMKDAGHLNTEAGFGEWLYGENLIQLLSGIQLEPKKL